MLELDGQMVDNHLAKINHFWELASDDAVQDRDESPERADLLQNRFSISTANSTSTTKLATR